MLDLVGKRILLFAPSFFGYDFSIKNKLEEHGAIVDSYDERPSTTIFAKSVIRYNRALYVKNSRSYYRGVFERHSSRRYDYVFIIKGEVLDSIILRYLKELFPNAITVLYLWDSLTNYPAIQSVIPLFDRVLSFDPEDVKNYKGMIFRPLFFVDELSEIKRVQFDGTKQLLFAGTLHSDRWATLKRIEGSLVGIDARLAVYLYVQSVFIYVFRKVFSRKLYAGLKIGNVRFKKMSREEVVGLTAASRAIIDIQHPKQVGLTMRTIEVLGAGRKLITTNSLVRDYDFYHPNNILVIDRLNPEISSEFLKADYVKISSEILKKYSLKGWIEEVFSGL